VWLPEVRARATEVSDRRLFAKPGEMTPGRVATRERVPKLASLTHHAIFDALAQNITSTGIPASFEQTQRVPTGHSDVCLCDVSGATNERASTIGKRSDGVKFDLKRENMNTGASSAARPGLALLGCLI